MTDIDKIKEHLNNIAFLTEKDPRDAPIRLQAVEALTYIDKIEKNSVLKCFYEDEPCIKIIAIYSDGSDCNLFFKSETLWYPVGDGLSFDHGVDKYWFADSGYLWFINLPDDFELWSE